MECAAGIRLNIFGESRKGYLFIRSSATSDIKTWVDQWLDVIDLTLGRWWELEDFVCDPVIVTQVFQYWDIRLHCLSRMWGSNERSSVGVVTAITTTLADETFGTFALGNIAEGSCGVDEPARAFRSLLRFILGILWRVSSCTPLESITRSEAHFKQWTCAWSEITEGERLLVGPCGL